MFPIDKHVTNARWPLRADVLALAACIVLFLLFPTLDLTVSFFLHDPSAGFHWAHAPLVRLSYEVFKARYIGIIAVVLTVYLAVSPFMRPSRARRRAAAFVLALMTIGPILIVNIGLKDHWGRARPVAIEQFGGDRIYSPPLQPTNQCHLNCSFVSGHAASAFALLMGPYWLTRRRRWMVASIALGSAAGLGRMMQGGHFLSDVVFAFWAIYLTGAVLSWLMLDRGRTDLPLAAKQADA